MHFTRMALLLLACVTAACQPPGSSRSPRSETRGNSLEGLLRAPGVTTRQEGIAAAILVDTSGSMKDRVADTDGESRPKIEIARRAVSNLLRQFDEFAGKSPDRRILVGVYEFSSRDREPSCRQVVKLGPPNPDEALTAINTMVAQGGTPIGDAMIHAKRDLDNTGMSRRHILVVTDGENNRGYAPGDVANVISQLPDEERPSMYFIAFDVAADRFNSVKEAGGLVLAAANERDLKQTLDFVLTGKILVEQPITPANR